MNRITVETGGERYHALLDRVIDIAIALDFGGAQPAHFGAARASAKTFNAGGFVGDTRQGGSCNCEEYRLTPHCVGTHTECVGHITDQRVAIHDCLEESLMTAAVISVSPVPAGNCDEKTDPAAETGDRLLTAASLAAVSVLADGAEALVIRTQPNDRAKMHTDYTRETAPYLTLDAIAWINQKGVRHLVVDLPSIDRSNDRGRLAGHRLFWGLPPGDRDAANALHPRKTITELAYIPDHVTDGRYLLNLQIPAFVADAAPSRPRLFPLRRVAERKAHQE